MEQVEGKTKTTNAERCKRYREANADVYKINDALRKKRARLLLKSDKTKYEAYKKKKEKGNNSLKSERTLLIETNRINTKRLWVHLLPSPTRLSNRDLSKRQKGLFLKVQEERKK